MRLQPSDIHCSRQSSFGIFLKKCFKNVLNLWITRKTRQLPNRLKRLRAIEVRFVQQFEALFDEDTLVFRKVVAHHTDAVVTFDDGGGTGGNHKRRQIFFQKTVSGEHRICADAAKLMNGGIPADIGVIVNVYMPARCHLRAYNDVIAQPTIVPDVRIRQDVIVIPDDGCIAVGGGGVHRNIFAEGIPIADVQSANTAFVLQIVRFAADEGVWVNVIVFPKGRVTVDRCVMFDDGVCADDRVCTDVCVRTNGDAFVQRGTWFDNGGRMEVHVNGFPS